MTDAPVELVGPPRRRTRVAAIISGIAAVVMIGLVWVLFNSSDALNRKAESPLIGKPAPVIAGTTIAGKPLDLDAYRGQWVIVNYFATWCIPCREEHPELVSFSRRHQQLGDASIVMVIYNDKVDAVREWFREREGDWPVIDDPSGRIAIDYGVAGVPETYVVDPSGIVRAKLIGGVTSVGLDRVLSNLAAGAQGSN